MASQKKIISQEGYKKIIDEITNLKENDIPETLEILKDARSQWDLSENSDYHAAKEKLALLQRRLAELEDILTNIEIAQEVKKTTSVWTVQYGSVVRISIEGDKEFEIQIVGESEVEVWDGRMAISLDSPLWQSILNKKQGDVVEMRLPTWNKNVTILNLS